MEKEEKSIHEQMKKLDETFGLACCKLLEKHPLYDYRTGEGSGYNLSVLLIGSGIRLEMLRDKILSNGQLLKTRLHVTILTEKVDEDRERLLKQAPELYRFINIQNAPGVNPPEWDLGTLEYKAFEHDITSLWKDHMHCRYVLISTENAEENTKIAEAISAAPGQLIARVEGDSIKIHGSEDMVFTPDANGYPEDIEEIAYLLHYAYEKGNNPHITTEEIRKSFRKEYNYESNIECALHVRSKLKSADIQLCSHGGAAEEFAKTLDEDARNGGFLLADLARLEHKRWCISKFLKGYAPASAEQCYLKYDETTHGNDWHVALVPYGTDRAPFRRLSDQDWDAPDPDSIPDLDELDKQTLRVHKRCGELALENLNFCIGKAEELKSALTHDLKIYADRLRDAMEQMRTGNRNAVFLYRHHLRNLKCSMAGADSKNLGNALNELEQAIRAPIEYLTRKDYKEQNFVLIRQIPFALSHRKVSTLVKLMSDQVQDCVSAAWQLEPNKLVFLDVAETLDELMKIRKRALQINYFLAGGCNPINISYHIFVPKNMQIPGSIGDATFLGSISQDSSRKSANSEITQESQPTFSEYWDCTLHFPDSLNVNHIRPHFVELMQELGPASIDMTGAKPELISIADGYSHNSQVGAFFLRDNEIRDFYGAASLERLPLDKGLSVQDLFAQAGAKRIKQDSEKLSSVFRDQYSKLWSIALDNSHIWYWFCQGFSKAYRDQPGNSKTRDPMLIDKNSLDEAIRTETERATRSIKGKDAEERKKDIAKRLSELPAILVQAKLLKLDKHNKFYTVSCEETLAALRNSGKALEYYIYCTAAESGKFQNVAMSWFFQHSWDPVSATNELDVVCTAKNTSLFISAKHVTLESFKHGNFLNYVCYEVGWLADRFGGIHHRMVLAAPNVPQFDKDNQPSSQVAQARKRGVYLLGKECFEGNHLIQVLENIVADKQDGKDDFGWCAFLCKALANR